VFNFQGEVNRFCCVPLDAFNSNTTQHKKQEKLVRQSVQNTGLLIVQIASRRLRFNALTH